jgi:hypothetical protein
MAGVRSQFINSCGSLPRPQQLAGGPCEKHCQTTRSTHTHTICTHTHAYARIHTGNRVRFLTRSNATFKRFHWSSVLKNSLVSLLLLHTHAYVRTRTHTHAWHMYACTHLRVSVTTAAPRERALARPPPTPRPPEKDSSIPRMPRVSTAYQPRMTKVRFLTHPPSAANLKRNGC